MTVSSSPFDSSPSLVSPNLAKQGRELPLAEGTPPAARSHETDWRIAVHESGHCIASRFYGLKLGGVTIVETGPYAGLAWGAGFKDGSSFDKNFDQTISVIESARPLWPKMGEPHSEVADFVAHARNRIVELLAGSAAEQVLCPDNRPLLGAARDKRQAREFAELLCQPEAVDAYLQYARTEAETIIAKMAHVVLALANALVEHRTMNGEKIDEVIADAVTAKALSDAVERRREWELVQKNAAMFLAHQALPRSY